MKDIKQSKKYTLLDCLQERFGARLEKIERTDKYYMLSCIAMYIALGRSYPDAKDWGVPHQHSAKHNAVFESVIFSIDPDSNLDEEIVEAIEAICINKESVQNSLLVSIAEQLNAT
jgi:hypothetical protein